MKPFTEIRINENKALIDAKAKIKKLKQFDKAWTPSFDKGGSAIGDYSKAYVDLYQSKGADKIIAQVVKKYPDTKIVKLGGHSTRGGSVVHNYELELIGSSEAMQYLKKEWFATQKKMKNVDKGYKTRVKVMGI
jgi:hypothetical protein